MPSRYLKAVAGSLAKSEHERIFGTAPPVQYIRRRKVA
jgi:hypothetical protein